MALSRRQSAMDWRPDLRPEPRAIRQAPTVAEPRRPAAWLLASRVAAYRFLLLCWYAALSLVTTLVGLGAGLAVIGTRSADGVAAESYQEGAFAALGTGLNGGPYLREGWLDRLPDGAVIDDSASLEFPFDAPKSGADAIEIAARAAAASGAGALRVDVLVNGRNVQQLRYAVREGASDLHTFKIPPEALALRRHVLITLIAVAEGPVVSRDVTATRYIVEAIRIFRSEPLRAQDGS